VDVPTWWEDLLIDALWSDTTSTTEWWVRGMSGDLPASFLREWLSNDPAERPRVAARAADGGVTAVVVADHACQEADALMALADSAIYQAKAADRGRYELIVPNGKPRPCSPPSRPDPIEPQHFDRHAAYAVVAFVAGG
jgi:hypothetical protein